MEKKKLTSLLISAGAGLLVLGFWFIGTFQGLENRSLDYRFKLRGPISGSKDVVIVAFDEESFKELGRWPWPRQMHGKVVDRLTRAGAKAIVFDMLLPEPDQGDPASDRYFAEAAKRSKRVAIGSFYRNDAEGNPIDFVLPIEMFRKNCVVGFVNISPELDGICRKIPLFKGYKGDIVPSLSLAGLSIYLNQPADEIIKSRKISIDEYYEMLINFVGGYESFPYYSFYKVLGGEIPAEKFKDKIVILGGTAMGLFDYKSIPYSPTFPGLEIHANAISNILQDNYLRPWPAYATFLLIVIFAALPGLVLNRFSPLTAGIVTLSGLAGYFLLVYSLFALKFIYAEFVAPASSFALSYVGVLFYRFMTKEKEKRKMKKTFGQLVNPRVLEKMLNDPSYQKVGGRKELLTVLFSDIRGFTTITENLPSEELVSQLNEYLGKMVEVVFRHDGTLDKFIGDAVMAIFGAPVPQNEHAKRAVLCAIDMMSELAVLQEKWRSEGKPVFEIGIGVNTGEMTVGFMGSQEKKEYTVIGDNVNLGSRLEGLNKEYKTHIIISDSTYQAVKDIIEAKPLGAVKVKGRMKPVDIFEVVGKK